MSLDKLSSEAAFNPGDVEQPQLTLGFVALADCASVVMAKELGIYRRYGLDVTLSRQPSWAAMRDRLLTGEIDAAHFLYGIVYAVQLGLGGPRTDMAILMGLNCNGQGIVLSQRLRDLGVHDAQTLKRVISSDGRTLTFAQTFPTGTHAMWLNYWLAAAGIDPARDVRVITIPPQQMPDAMRSGKIDGFCVGEPWSSALIASEHLGFRVAGTHEIWLNHPDKVLATTRDFATRNPGTARTLIAAILDSARYCDDARNHSSIVGILAQAGYVDASPEAIDSALDGEKSDRSGADAEPHLRFFGGGEVPFPFVSDGMWFMTQLRRWGLLTEDVDYRAVAQSVTQTELYRQVANALGIDSPAHDDRIARLSDGVVWDATHVASYLDSFAI